MTLYLIGDLEFGDTRNIQGALQHLDGVIYRIQDLEEQTVDVDDFDDSELNFGVIDNHARFDEILNGDDVHPGP